MRSCARVTRSSHITLGGLDGLVERFFCHSLQFSDASICYNCTNEFDEFIILVPSRPGCPGQNPESHKMVVLVV